MIRIIADTTAGLPTGFAQAHAVPVLPQIVIFGEESYRDDTELDTRAFMQKLRASAVMPKTAAPPPAMYLTYYQQYLDQGDSVLVITPTSKASGTYRSALTAAQDFPGAELCVFDSLSISAPLASMVMQAVAWAEEGMDINFILEGLRGLMSRQRLYILLDTLEFLRRGGRIGGAQHLIGSLLQVKPLLVLRDGQIEAHSQVRTRRKGLECLKEIVCAECQPGEPGHLCVIHADAEAEAVELAARLSCELSARSIPVLEVPPALVVHAGPGALGAGFFAK